MFYLGSEQRERSQQFDTYIDAGLTVLDNPTIAQFLGDHDSQQLRTILTDSVLPNLRHGAIKIPLRKLLGDSSIVTPASEELFQKAWGIFQESYGAQLPTSKLYKGETHYSRRFGETYERTGKKLPKPSSLELPTPPTGIRHYAATSVLHFGPVEKWPYFGLSRPFVTFRTELLAEAKDVIGSLALHEAVHDQDHREHGPIASIEFAVATELRAFRLGAGIAEEYEQTNGTAGIIRAVEAQRVARRTAAQEYVVDSDLIEWMLERALVVAPIPVRKIPIQE